MWTVPIVILRDLLGDLDELLYQDARLQTILAISAFRVSSEVSFDVSYSVDLTSGSETVTPDFNDPIDGDFINLMCLRAAIRVTSAEIKLSAGEVTSIQDDKAKITMGRSSTLKNSLSDLQNSYDEYVKNYLAGKSKGAGAIMSPTTRLNSSLGYYGERE